MFGGSVQLGWNGGAVDQKIMKLAGRGLEAATIHLLNRTREALSVPAPRRRTKSGRYVATTRAIPGAPPRKLSGTLRRSMAFQMMRQKTIGRVGTNLLYGRPLETWMNHSFLTYSLNRAMGEIRTIMQGAWGGSMSTTVGFNS